ncbi:hypothetical protein TIN4_66 [Tsukamurella phage TIN4]|uniref:Uncharacterized protein n=2 Tax=Tinduovirus TIN3 TaxID=1982571 RepID=A0A0K0N6C6_9CAUD|nr:hypothetical protein AVT54_gp059 [Tsukamurella phage TIN3]YP_009604196.1 hypothetical protein FDH87_gp059 [Tsukamurella phage TIN4]AKJ71863.1 hypothetical protein TIN3_66 [Tsukamurella phage TIN3]AKJ71972.1 hypothetical protein TIN4_66 [Tsukamurella phage TIN4]
MNIFDFKDALMKLMAKYRSGKSKVVFVDSGSGDVYETTGSFKVVDGVNVVGIQLVE